MAVPAEIARQLSGEPQAHAALGCGLHGPIGETHLVVADGQLHLFTRESLLGEFAKVPLEAPPKLEPGDFSDALHVALADGSSAELNVSSLERDAVNSVLSRATTTAAPQAVAPPTPQPQPAPAPPAAHDAPRAEPDDEDDEPGKAPEDELADKDEAVYHGGEIGFMTCLTQFILFAGAIAALWFLHDQAVIGLYGPGGIPDDGFIYISTKALAIMAGVYAGARLAGLVTHIGHGRNWSGRVEFSRRSVVIVGKNGLWKVSIDTSRPFELLAAQVVNPNGPRGKTSGTNRNEYWYYIRLSQQGQAAALRFLRFAAESLPSLAGLQVAPGEHEMPQDRTLRMNERTFLKVAARLHKLHEPFAKAGSTGDNGSA